MTVVWAVIIGLSFRAYSVGYAVVPNLDIIFLKVCILRIHPISLRVSLVNLFWQQFKLLIEDSLVPEIYVVQILVSLSGVHLLVILVMVVTLSQSNLVVLVQLILMLFLCTP